MNDHRPDQTLASPGYHLSKRDPRVPRTERKEKAKTANATLTSFARTKPARIGKDCIAKIFQAHRPRLFGVAYRMLRSRVEAEDLLQEAYLRWHQSANEGVHSPIAFLVTLTTRLCLDRLRELKHEYEQNAGRCPPESIVEDPFPSPEMQLELAEEASVAFLAVLERLGPQERAAFLLHDVFDYDYREVAQVLGKAEPTCRQMIHRARARVRASHPRFSLTPESRARVLGKFHAALATGDRGAVMELLAEDVECMADGGGEVVAPLRVLQGPERIGRLYDCIASRSIGLGYRVIRANGELSAVAMMEGRDFAALSFVIDGERSSAVHSVRNPDKLVRIVLRDLAA